jgi:hypothetical protein
MGGFGVFFYGLGVVAGGVLEVFIRNAITVTDYH